MNTSPSRKSRPAGNLRKVCFFALVVISFAPASVAYSATIPRSVLKSFFEKGDKPTQAQFEALIDSLLHRTEDRDLLGMRSASDGGGERFTEGMVIGPDSTFTQVAGLSDVWAGQSGFLPLAFLENSQTYYGYLQISAGDPDSTDVYPMFVEYFVYEDQPGVPIVAAAVPEPSAFHLAGAAFVFLALGARRRLCTLLPRRRQVGSGSSSR